MDFTIVPDSTWRLSDCIDGTRRTRLLTSPFELIMSRMAEEAQLDSYNMEESRDRPGLVRVWFKLRLPADLVDLFHNGAAGYRAQFYNGIEGGEQANRWAIDMLTHAVMDLLSGQRRPKCSWALAEASLKNEGAKLWIHQGTWYRQAWRSIRHLEVERWARNGKDEAQLRKSRIPLWARLVPEHEHRLDVIGGWLNPDLTSAGVQMKPYRSRELQMLGFT